MRERGDQQVAFGQVAASQAEPGQWVVDIGIGPRVVDYQVGADLVERVRDGFADDVQVVDSGQPGRDRDGEILGLFHDGNRSSSKTSRMNAQGQGWIVAAVPLP